MSENELFDHRIQSSKRFSGCAGWVDRPRASRGAPGVGGGGRSAAAGVGAARAGLPLQHVVIHVDGSAMANGISEKVKMRTKR